MPSSSSSTGVLKYVERVSELLRRWVCTNPQGKHDFLVSVARLARLMLMTSIFHLTPLSTWHISLLLSRLTYLIDDWQFNGFIIFFSFWFIFGKSTDVGFCWTISLRLHCVSAVLRRRSCAISEVVFKHCIILISVPSPILCWDNTVFNYRQVVLHSQIHFELYNDTLQHD